MKICPTCRKTYADDNLNFCLEDGTVLTVAANEPPATVMMNSPRPTDPVSPFTAGNQPGIQSSFGNQPQYSIQQPKKSSKAWLWVVGIVGILLLLCGGGFVGLVLIGMNAERAASNNSTYPTNNRGNTSTTNTSASPASSPFSSSGDVESVDLSFWVKDFSVWGTTEMSGDEFQMAAKQKGYYYVLVAPEEYTTDGKNVRVTVRNVDNSNSSLGYGLIFHSAPTPLTKDYAFLIDTKRKKYRVVRHEPTKETSMVAWTNSTAIRDGSQENVLEARDKGDNVELYINDQMVTSVKDQFGYPNGVPGLYSGDGAKIGFKKLEIWK